MNSFSNQRENLLWLTIVLFVFLAETINFANAYPMIVEVEESSERVSFLMPPKYFALQILPSTIMRSQFSCLYIHVCLYLETHFITVSAFKHTRRR